MASSDGQPSKSVLPDKNVLPNKSVLKARLVLSLYATGRIRDFHPRIMEVSI